MISLLTIEESESLLVASCLLMVLDYDVHTPLTSHALPYLSHSFFCLS